jgi:ribosomal protein S18 acetylase RimI-like enzyme
LINYRELEEGDIAQLQRVALRVWGFTYRGIYTPESIRRQVSTYYAPEVLEAMISGARHGRFCFRIALDGAKLIGYVNGGRASGTWRLLKFLPKEAGSVSGWELFRIYLLPEYIGKGIGKELLRQWEEFLREKKAKKYSVHIEPKNKLGRRFYLRNGFVRARELDRGRSSPCFVKTL